MTSYDDIYEAFLAKILDDEWESFGWEEDIAKDMRLILEGAIPWFMFPRTSLERNDEGFVETLSPQEVQILATYMKCEWLNRSIMTWENVKPLYDERDFSQANLLDRLVKTLENEQRKAYKLEEIYYRSISGKPFDYTKMVGR